MGLFDVPMFMSLFGFGIGMMFASSHVRGMMLLFSDKLYMLVRYANPICLRCLMLTLSGPMELLFLLCFIAAWTCVVVSVRSVVCSFECFPIYVSVCSVCFMFDCVGELFIECVCYLCG